MIQYGEVFGWNGGERPVDPDIEVRVWFRNGKIREAFAGNLTWEWGEKAFAYETDISEYDIIAYQVGHNPNSAKHKFYCQINADYLKVNGSLVWDSGEIYKVTIEVIDGVVSPTAKVEKES